MGEAVKLLTLLTLTGSDCPYALVQFSGDTCHALLPKEGQLSVQVAEGTASASCRRVSQLQVCQLLSSGSQVVYPAWLNGCDVPLITSPPEPMAKGINLLSSNPIYLKVEIPLPNMEGPELKAPPLGGHSPSTLVASPIRPPLPKAGEEVSMTMEVRELLSWAGLNMSEHTGSSTPKRQEPVVLVTPLLTKLEGFPKPVNMSSRVSAPDDGEMEDASLEEILAPSSPTAEASGPIGDAPPPDVAHLWEEANKAVGELLAVKSSLDTHWWKLVLELSMTLHENDSEAMESIKEAKAVCIHSIQEAEDCCSVAIREAEGQRASQAISIQQSHHKTVQCLEEERKSQLNFLSICQAALRTSPPELHSMLLASYHILLGHARTAHFFGIPQRSSPFPPGPTPRTSSPPMPDHSPGP